MNPASIPLEGKVAVVTGGRRGIGRAIALRFAGAGADVAVCDFVSGTELDAVAEEIRSFGRRSLAIQVDVGDKTSVNNLVQKVEDKLGDIDILANAAGTLRITPTVELSEEDWDIVMNTNLKGCFLLCQAVAKRMIKRRKGGSIINIASTDAYNPIPYQVSYNCSKAGVVMFTNTLAFEVGKHNIRVNAIAPGTVNTEMLAAYGIDDAVSAGEVALGRISDPVEIANVALFLASDLASYVTGATWRVDGGISAGSLSMWPEKITPGKS